jgi:EF hand
MMRLQSLVTALALLILSVSSLSAQDDGGRSRGFDVEGFLRRMDANGDGQLQASEMSGRTARFVERLGFDTSQDVSVEDVIRRARGDDNDDGGDRDGRGDNREATENAEGRKIVRKVPGFDLPADKGGTVAGFSAQAVLSASEVEAEYGEEVSSQVERALRRYDGNENGVLESNEWSEGQWGNPSPAESDVNSDGVLTRYELAERYKTREFATRRGESGENDRGGDEGRERARDDGDRESRGGANEDRDEDRRRQERAEAENPGSGDAESAGTESDRMRSYAEQLLKQYDKDSDGQLSQEEVNGMRRPPANADQNGDGMVSVGELMDSLQGGQTATRSVVTPSRSDESGLAERPGRERGSSRRPRGDEGDRDSFRERSGSRPFSFNSSDLNGDGQVQMHEFETDWTEERLQEYLQLDRNRDGVITREESGG